MKYLLQYLPTLNSISLQHAWDINTKKYPKEYVAIIPVSASFHFASDYYLGLEQPHATMKNYLDTYTRYYLRVKCE